MQARLEAGDGSGRGQEHRARRMLVLLAGLLVLHFAPCGRARHAWCPEPSPNSGNATTTCSTDLDWSNVSSSPPRLNLTSCCIGEIKGSARLGHTYQVLDLSSNHLQSLPQEFLSQAHALRELRLHCNQLQTLPPEFFANTSHLEVLSLQGNPLPGVPASAFQPSLQQLTVDCRCDVVGSVLSHCACSAQANCTPRVCHCLTSQEQGHNVTNFYERQCQGPSPLLTAAITSSMVALLLLAGGLGGAFLLLRRKRRASVAHGKRESSASIAHRQPRYISRSAEPGRGQGPHQAHNYENIFIGQAQPVGQYECLERQVPQYRAQPPVDECYMENGAFPSEQPIYTNTQELYGPNQPASHDTEDVYIIPDT
ncbi:uncharacterized protein LOC142002242 [Carettochelys insculpta]|uniref:uncharacterized protein LOC142002242 n=1 Tax=Carettochelys insculpta TaxID=44489 RepID=UPI003EB78094